MIIHDLLNRDRQGKKFYTQVILSKPISESGLVLHV